MAVLRRIPFSMLLVLIGGGAVVGWFWWDDQQSEKQRQAQAEQELQEARRRTERTVKLQKMFEQDRKIAEQEEEWERKTEEKYSVISEIKRRGGGVSLSKVNYDTPGDVVEIQLSGKQLLEILPELEPLHMLSG